MGDVSVADWADRILAHREAMRELSDVPASPDVLRSKAYELASRQRKLVMRESVNNRKLGEFR